MQSFYRVVRIMVLFQFYIILFLSVYLKIVSISTILNDNNIYEAINKIKVWVAIVVHWIYIEDDIK